ncbi:Coatomer subunit epsilon [Golovinomyces cichoracearum]|uniref:Coatomer subunit epsilon n=1 Tax=Golovinomyces cichoracearum TaxID=62708 RepID=A0A420J6A9_9PEZI|nr:Coatomer subunit epsilon [Golovinomyces cichoracearum]
MDLPNKDDELITLQNMFHQGQFEKVVEYDLGGVTAQNLLATRVLQLRAEIALGNTEKVIEEVGSETKPELVAVGALAEILRGNQDEALEAVARLTSVKETTLVLVATVLHLAGKSDDALSMLQTHEGDLEAVALMVQIYLQQNRTDLAVKEVAAAKKWAQDSLLANLAESWVGLRLGGENYQQAFYVFEELAQAPSTTSSHNLISQAVSEIHLGRLEEAEIALQQVLASDKNNADAIVNSIVLKSIAGQDTSQLLHDLETTAPDHIFLQDLRQKNELFDKAALKYSAKVVAT